MWIGGSTLKVEDITLITWIKRKRNQRKTDILNKYHEHLSIISFSSKQLLARIYQLQLQNGFELSL